MAVEIPVLELERDLSIKVFSDLHLALQQGDRGLIQYKEPMLPLQEEALVYGACAPDAEDLSKLYVFGHWSMQVVLSLRGSGEAFVVAVEILLQERIGVFHARDLGQAHILYQPVLKRAEETFHPALGLR